MLSELRRCPGPTHSVWDVMASAVALFTPGSRMAMLGFSGGGMVGAMRALGCDQEIAGVDLWSEGFSLFQRVAADWCGSIRFYEEDAVRWLRRQRILYDVIVEDLSVPKDGDIVKPEVSLSLLPALMRKKLIPGGVIISNLLPTPGYSWPRMIAAARTGRGVVVEFESYHNRILIQGSQLGEARAVGRHLRRIMRRFGSDSGGVRIRSL